MASPQGGAASAALRRRKAAQNRTAFNAIVATPADWGDPVVLPANSRLGISFSEDLAAGDITVSDGVNTFGIPDIAADVVHNFPHQFERGREITVNNVTAPAGDITLYVLDEWTRPAAIASTTFA